MLCRPTTHGLSVLAPAKLNLFLRIVRKRPDGFHDIESVMAAINLYDTLSFEAIPADKIELAVIDAYSRSSAGVLRSDAPTGATNLVVRAAMLLKEHAAYDGGVRISLVKRIPSSAGLGGGSSDCAATIGALNRLWKLGIPDAKLSDIAAQLGSDVPFFLGKTPVALCTGRGEVLEPFRVSTGLHFVVAKPLTGLSTPAVYRSCVPDQTNQDTNQFVKALADGNICQMARRLHNGLQTPAESLSSDVRRLRSLFEQESVVGHQMSGSGSSYFAVCRTAHHAMAVARRIAAAGIPWVKVVRSCP
jgi:4-diphosphocytidyl-2-C-methyl-D-erythritol kinase